MKWKRLFLAATLVAATAACTAHPAAPEPSATAASVSPYEIPPPAANQTAGDSVQVTGESGIVGSVGG